MVANQRLYERPLDDVFGPVLQMELLRNSSSLVIDWQARRHRKLASLSLRFAVIVDSPLVEEIPAEIGNVSIGHRFRPSVKSLVSHLPEFSTTIEVFQDNFRLTLFQELFG